MNNWLIQRLGASVEELAKAQYEELMGFDGEGGHKAPRADIAKMKQYYNLQIDATPWGAEPHPNPEAARQWQEMAKLTPAESAATQLYSAGGGDFDSTVDRMERGSSSWEAMGLPPGMSRDEAKTLLSSALKKKQTAAIPNQYVSIDNILGWLLKNNPESYKLWPWAVKQIKSDSIRFPLHMRDIVGEAGRVIDQERRQNRLPQNFDINQMSFEDLENWLMQWKRDNREAESQGEVVYKYDDGWTMQRLTKPEQLQYEGDEMGNCVGGYASDVKNQQSIIYSLRDPKGNPHVTMELEGEELDHPDESIDQRAKYYSPHDIEDNVDYLRTTPTTGDRTWDKTFQVVQVQGNSNSSPKPEYQHKVKEFLDSLKSKGFKLERSENWYSPHDQDDDSRDDWFDLHSRWRQGENDAAHENWWTDSYRTGHSPQASLYLNEQQDVYGIHQPKRKPGFTPDHVQAALRHVMSCAESPEEAAQEIFHIAILDNWGYGQLVAEISDARSGINDQMSAEEDMAYSNGWMPEEDGDGDQLPYQHDNNEGYEEGYEFLNLLDQYNDWRHQHSDEVQRDIKNYGWDLPLPKFDPSMQMTSDPYAQTQEQSQPQTQEQSQSEGPSIPGAFQ